MRHAAAAVLVLLAIGATVGANVSAYIAWILYTVLPSSGAQRIGVTSIPARIPHPPGPELGILPLVGAISVLVICAVVVRRSPR